MFPSVRFHYAGDVTVKPGHTLGPRRIGDYELVFFPAGTAAAYAVDGVGEVRLQQPCVLLTRPREPHTHFFDPVEATRHLYVHFDWTDDGPADRYARVTDARRLPVVRLREDSLIPQSMRQMLFYFHAKPGRWQARAALLLLGVLEEMEAALEEGSPSRPAAPAWPAPLHAAMRYVDEHLTDRIDIAQLAETVGWTHEHFTRTFRRHVGHGPREWINRRRIEHAAQLLLQRTDSAKRIALESGFKDEYYFHRLFRRITGLTTTEYRRRYADPRQLELAPPEGRSKFYPLNHFFRLDGAESGNQIRP